MGLWVFVMLQCLENISFQRKPIYYGVKRCCGLLSHSMSFPSLPPS